MKMIRIVEVMWAVIAAVSAYEVYAQWTPNRQRAYMFLAFMALAIFMFFFRRRYRMRYEQRRREESQDQ
jgi:transposase